MVFAGLYLFINIYKFIHQAAGHCITVYSVEIKISSAVHDFSISFLSIALARFSRTFTFASNTQYAGCFTYIQAINLS